MDITNITSELWKPIDSHEGIYDISTDGRLKDVKANKIIPESEFKEDIRGYLYIPSEIGNSPGEDVDGTTPGKLYIHIAVANAFIPPPKVIQKEAEGIPKYVAHNDYDTSNNNLYNLAFVYNYRDSFIPVTAPIIAKIQTGKIDKKDLRTVYKMSRVQRDNALKPMGNKHGKSVFKKLIGSKGYIKRLEMERAQ